MTDIYDRMDWNFEALRRSAERLGVKPISEKEKKDWFPEV